MNRMKNGKMLYIAISIHFPLCLPVAVKNGGRFSPAGTGSKN